MKLYFCYHEYQLGVICLDWGENFVDVLPGNLEESLIDIWEANLEGNKQKKFFKALREIGPSYWNAEGEVPLQGQALYRMHRVPDLQLFFYANLTTRRPPEFRRDLLES